MHGIFVEQRLRHLINSQRIETRVLAPVPWFPCQHELFGRYAIFARVPRQEHRHGINVLHPRYPLVPKIGMTAAPFLLAMALKNTVRRLIADGYDFDVIDAHYFYPDGVAAALLGKAFRRPVVITARGSDLNLIARYRLPRRMIAWAARSAAANIAVSQALRNILLAISGQSAKIIVMRNGVDLELFKPLDRDACKRRLGVMGTMLLSVGQLIESKGHDVVIRVLAKLHHCQLFIAGSGRALKQLQALAASCGVADRVTFLGTVQHGQLGIYYSAADALVLASEREGWPNVLLESLACGTPVIASNVGGISEIIAAPEAGIIVRERTPEAFVDAYRSLFAHYPARGAVRRYAERFSWDETSCAQATLFSKVKERYR
jgi:glycosyltransferase involved in cell wall biosynthesis